MTLGRTVGGRLRTESDPEFTLDALTPVPQHVTVLGDRLFKEVTELQ